MIQTAETGRRVPGTPAFGWGLALVSFLVAFGVRNALADALPPGFPFLTFFPAVILTTFLGGLWPGIAVAVVSGLAAWWFFIPPARTFVLDGPVLLALGFYVFVVAVDIAIIHKMTQALERLRDERHRSQRLAASREVMFQELQHRVSNNLQLVSALMQLQKAEVRDPDARRVLEEAAGRLALVGKIHRRLHDPAGQRVELDRFLEELCRDVLGASAARSVACEVAAEPLPLPADRAIPLALVVAELVSNAVEHAFVGREGGTIKVEVARAAGGRARLTVADDGNGLAPGFDPDRSTSLGLRIVRAFAAQLGGTFAMTSPQGTRCSLDFPLAS